MKKMIALVAGTLLALPAMALASGGLIGDCVNCHTMHNSELGQAVAKMGTTGTITQTPIQNLLRLDCISCHVVDPAGASKIAMLGDSAIPQVMHADATGDLAGGNFGYINTLSSNRKGHNVVDLFAGGDTNGGTYNTPPGKYRASTHTGVFTATTPFDLFTCAGAAGCHGTRSQMLSGSTADWDANATTANTFQGVKRTGIASISGAHHNSYDGSKAAAVNATSEADALHDGQRVADGYRFIPGLKGYGNEAARWQNVNATSHNEYFGDSDGLSVSGCGNCHIEGHDGGLSSRMAFNSTLKVPENSMSGFCATCHGSFHSAGDNNGTISNTGGNGTSSAFLRHPSDYVIKEAGEYAAYNAYDLTAPVARPLAGLAGPSGLVTGGTDMVMCLSCHQAHASQYDAMLRFDYAEQTAGNAVTGLGKGCLACHTEKGILPENR